MTVVPDRRIAFTQRLNALELNQKRVKEAISKIGKHMRHLLAKTREYNGSSTSFLIKSHSFLIILVAITYENNFQSKDRLEK